MPPLFAASTSAQQDQPADEVRITAGGGVMKRSRAGDVARRDRRPLDTGMIKFIVIASPRR